MPRTMKVELMDYSGSDLLVVDAARVSFSKKSDWEQVEVYGSDEHGEFSELINVLNPKDERLINFLAREKHLLPFRHPTITFRCKAPLFVARQLGKHQTGMSWSEESRRYIDSEPEFFWPETWRKRAENVKQGSSDEPVDPVFNHDVQSMCEAHSYEALEIYKGLLNDGVAPELARMILPQNMHINWVWTGTLLSWVHMIKERTGPTAQRETQQFARMIEEELVQLYPCSMKALLSTEGE